ncbi:LysR family transcriptional regulator [Streptococcus didelphis]|uniref:LysR family transcriptional regulator n=1 Tax=Streptococcus didelphis TaxID=102886 RepID=A0ABY9LGF8_9STRE|nr:LysR family transcriptional regulator [Streptococcus didelphis]WMB27966.1 LysR family transcriptional regulator [Streptococcus didelphis]WMB29567.1 LysR family transcriptional regulator [Streptococcus didelphis]
METPKKIKYLEMIETYASITKAAKALFIAQPYLSKLIKQLEMELEIDLYKTQSHKTQLTYAGKRYLYYLKQMDSLERQMKKRITVN